MRVSSSTSVTCVLHFFVIILKNYIATYLLHFFLMVKSDKSRWVPILYLFTFYKSKCFKSYIRNSLQVNGKHDTLYLIYLDSLHLKRVKSEFKVEKSTLEWNPRSPIHHVRHFWALESVAKKIGIAQLCSVLLSFTQIHSAFLLNFCWVFWVFFISDFNIE